MYVHRSSNTPSTMSILVCFWHNLPLPPPAPVWTSFMDEPQCKSTVSLTPVNNWQGRDQRTQWQNETTTCEIYALQSSTGIPIPEFTIEDSVIPRSRRDYGISPKIRDLPLRCGTRGSHALGYKKFQDFPGPQKHFSRTQQSLIFFLNIETNSSD